MLQVGGARRRFGIAGITILFASTAIVGVSVGGQKMGVSGVRGMQAASYSSSNLLTPVSTSAPDEMLFPRKHRPNLQPVYSKVPLPLQTNKFWGNWLVNDGSNLGMSIFPAPYTLAWDQTTGGMVVMKGQTDYGGLNGNPISFFTNHWFPDFTMHTVEGFTSAPKIVKQSHFGVHIMKDGDKCSANYMIFAGMAYVTTRYYGHCTPHITTNYELKTVAKIRAGVWQFKSSRKEYRVYALTNEGDFVDNSYEFDANGKMNKALVGYLRLAYLEEPTDAAVLDDSARTILTDWSLRVEPGKVMYDFGTVGPDTGKFLHWAYGNHMDFLSGGAAVEEGMARTISPVKGYMWPLRGSNTWIMTMDISEILEESFVPAEEPAEWALDEIDKAIDADWAWFKTDWRRAMHKRDHYFSGKGFQKLGQLCHIMRERKGSSSPEIAECAEILKSGFKCMYDRNVSDGSDRRLGAPEEDLQMVGCWWSPFGTWYDLDFGGIPSRWDDSPTCGLDFGNGCYNDHHYHWGYYVVSAAMLADLMPEMLNEPKFIELIEMYIRDVGNPSTDDKYFPQFRSFDWFDMHSWSRGLKPDPSGKDQESTSEEVNFHFGLKLWGDVTGNAKFKQLGATMLAASAKALQEYYLMKRDNRNHPWEFAINHVTGIFFQNKVHLTTWFGQDTRYIHGIQMLPLTAGLTNSRKSDYAWEEWVDTLDHLEITTDDPWWSILLSGNLAMHDPHRAFDELVKFNRTKVDDGLTKAWALYWTAVQSNYTGHPLPSPYPAPSPSPSPSPSPTPPTPVPSPGEPWIPCSVGPCCDPTQNPPQYCPGSIQCQECNGEIACQCPTPP